MQNFPLFIFSGNEAIQMKLKQENWFNPGICNYKVFIY